MRGAVNPLVRSTLLAAALVAAALSALPAASAGIDLCPSNVCVQRDGVCLRAVWTIAIDFAAGAGSCPEVSAGSEGVSACEFVWAGFGTFGGFQGVILDVCAVQDESGATCVTPYAEVFQAGTTLDPLCLA